MANIFQVTENLVKIELYYSYEEIENAESFLKICDNETVSQEYKKGFIFLRKPNWTLLHDLQVKSSTINPYNGEMIINRFAYNDEKLKKFLIKLEDCDGIISEANHDFINNMPPNLCVFISNKIDELIDNSLVSRDVLNKEESKEFAFECFKYFKAMKSKSRAVPGYKVHVPPPPSILIIRDLCERFNITPDQARTISQKDLQMFNIASEQERICNEMGN